ncbi:hypothetical protein CR513_43290, partial [Mucuna pruriens]
MGYIDNGRNSLKHIFRFKTTIANFVRLQSQTALSSHSPLLSNALFSTTFDTRIVKDLLVKVERDQLRLGLNITNINVPSSRSLRRRSSRTPLTCTTTRSPPTLNNNTDKETKVKVNKRHPDFKRKFRRYQDLLKNFTNVETLDKGK